MNSFQRGLIEKSGYDNGWENVNQSTPDTVILSSARHSEQVQVALSEREKEPIWLLLITNQRIASELRRSFPAANSQGESYQATSELELGKLLRRTAELAQSLPNQAEKSFQERLKKALERIKDSGTEAERIVKQRIGQDAFREALMDYWGGSCAVTNISTPEVLRASHAKPWAACESDEDRLNVYNGFLLSANLDALFDKGLITFDNEGVIQISSRLNGEEKQRLSLTSDLKLRWLDPNHEPILAYHRLELFKT